MNNELGTKDAIWDQRPEGIRHPRSIYPPMKCLVVNGQNERIPGVFHVDFGAERVGKWKCRLDEFGLEEYELIVEQASDGSTKKKLVEEWVTVPGVKVIPFPAGYEAGVAERNEKKKKKMRADAAGRVTENSMS